MLSARRRSIGLLGLFICAACGSSSAISTPQPPPVAAPRAVVATSAPATSASAAKSATTAVAAPAPTSTEQTAPAPTTVSMTWKDEPAPPGAPADLRLEFGALDELEKLKFARDNGPDPPPVEFVGGWLRLPKQGIFQASLDRRFDLSKGATIEARVAFEGSWCSAAFVIAASGYDSVGMRWNPNNVGIEDYIKTSHVELDVHAPHTYKIERRGGRVRLSIDGEVRVDEEGQQVVDTRSKSRVVVPWIRLGSSHGCSEKDLAIARFDWIVFRPSAPDLAPGKAAPTKVLAPKGPLAPLIADIAKSSLRALDMATIVAVEIPAAALPCVAFTLVKHQYSRFGLRKLNAAEIKSALDAARERDDEPRLGCDPIRGKPDSCKPRDTDPDPAIPALEALLAGLTAPSDEAATAAWNRAARSALNVGTDAGAAAALLKEIQALASSPMACRGP